MRIVRPSALLVLLLLASCAQQPKEPVSLAPDTFNYRAMLGDPPADGSAQQKQEIEKILQLQAQRNQDDIERCELEVNGTPIGFAAMALGGWFNEYDFPLTASLLNEITIETRAISNAAKSNWKRKRPYDVDERVVPCVHIEHSSSYPSGHATRAIVWATILSELFPNHRKELMTEARKFGHDRVLAGVHYPSDVAAGQRLGAEIAKRILANPDYEDRLDAAKQECKAADRAHPAVTLLETR